VNAIEAFILGIIQGATEFLPVSSSGHLVIGQALMDIRIPGVAFEVALHVATLLSVTLVYRKRIGELVVGVLKGKGDAWRFFGLLVVATIPAGLVGVGAGDLIERLFDSPVVVGGALLVTGGLLWTTRGALARNPQGKPGLREAIIIGFAQAFAIIPGISRSGTTVAIGLWLGLEAEEAAAFSFLMAIPAILGAAVLKFPDLQGGGIGIGVGPLLLGSLAAAITGIFAIWTFVAMLKKKSFYKFAPYCWTVGILFLLFLIFGR